jgi:hypothetical protein
MKDVSIILPSIRPNNLEKFYAHAKNACKKYSFEIVIASPYSIPDSLMKKEEIKYLHTYANPTISFQMAALLCDSEFIYNTTDDGLIQEDCIDIAIDLFRENKIEKHLINMIYDEGVLDIDTLELLNPDHKHFDPSYWRPWTHGDLRLPGIQQNWKICPHFFMKTKYFIELGGFDCNYEYSNHALHDLAFRAQADGAVVTELPKVAFYCSHGHSDHKPIEEAQLGPDASRFNSIYSNPGAAFRRILLNYDDWKNRERVWTRRFDPNNLRLRP